MINNKTSKLDRDSSLDVYLLDDRWNEQTVVEDNTVGCFESDGTLMGDIGMKEDTVIFAVGEQWLFACRMTDQMIDIAKKSLSSKSSSQ